MNPTIVKEYMEKGESWENDPMSYVDAFAARRDMFKEALDGLDKEEMVKSWSDKTLGDVEYAGSDLAFTKEQRVAIREAAIAELSSRNPAQEPTGHGMGADGTQQSAPEGE